MDAFYASVEQRDNPALRGRPVAVGGAGERGVVCAASYEARPFGVRSAMPMATARQLCPDLVVVAPRFEAYREASATVHAVFRRHTDLVEPLSLDEAYLDVSEPLTGALAAGPPSAVRTAEAIRAEIRSATGLTASAGVSFCKFLAKVASDLDKPDGFSVTLPHEAHAFLAALPVERFHGVGPASARRRRGASQASASRPAPTSRRAPKPTSGRPSARPVRGCSASRTASTTGPSGRTASASPSASSGRSSATSAARRPCSRASHRSPTNSRGASTATARVRGRSR